MKSLNSKDINIKFLNNLLKYPNNIVFSIRNNSEKDEIFINKLCLLIKTLNKNEQKIELFITLKSLKNINKFLNLLNKYPYVMIHYLNFTFTYSELIKYVILKNIIVIQIIIQYLNKGI